MEWVLEFFSSLIWIFAVTALVAKKKGIKVKDAEKYFKNAKGTGMARLSQLQKYAKTGVIEAADENLFESDEAAEAENTLGKVPVSTLSKLFKEDRSNDWLARQMREEGKRTVWNNFSDLGAQHDAICDAKVLRIQHHLRHEENIVDDGTV